MPGGVCKTIICGGPWAAVEQAGRTLLKSEELPEDVKRAIAVVCENAATNWQMTKALSVGADPARADAVDQWAKHGANASTELLLFLTDGI